MENNIKKLRKESIDFMHSKWAKDSVGNKNLDIGYENFENIVKNVFENIILNKKQFEKPFIFRTGGQSGSGKTTQLMPSIQSVIDNKKLSFINIAVRDFAKYHPNYEELLNEFGEGMIREKTNGFALNMLFRITELLIENHYNILLEVTLLDESFEEYFVNLAKSNNYNIHFHILSIPRSKSDLWIEKRKSASKKEGNRIVLKSSSNFFYDILPITLNKLININLFDKNDEVFLWNGFEMGPFFFGSIYNNKEFIRLFNEYRNIENFEEKDESELLKSKINWFNEYYEKRI